MDESGPARRIPKGRSRLPDEPSESLRLASSQGVRTVRKRRLSIEVSVDALSLPLRLATASTHENAGKGQSL
jgi:hypothetical protein